MINDSLNDYIGQLQLLSFFSGYPLVYALVNFAVAERRKKLPYFSKRWIELLPFAYALVGTLFFGFLLKNISPDFSLKHISDLFQSSYLEVWGIMSILFWIPMISKKTVFSLLHSLPFFFLLVKDFFMQTTFNSARLVIGNDMKMYTISIVLNAGALVIVFVIFFLLRHFVFDKTLP